MHNPSKKITALITSIIFVLSTIIPVFAINDSLEIKFKVSSASYFINGNKINSQKSFIKSGSTYVPLRTMLEAFGAEINWFPNGKLELIYRNTKVGLTLGEKKYTLNDEENQLLAEPILVNNTTMVPARLIAESFGATIDFDNKTSDVRIFLNDDGAIKDYSSLLDSVGNKKVGNSYFDWSINVPKGSRVINSSFNSKDVMITNEQTGISTSISIGINEKNKTLDDYYKDILEDSEKELGIEKVDAKIQSNVNPKYIEILYTDGYEDIAVVSRVYVNDRFIYNISLSSETDNNPKKLKANTFYMGILDSFVLGFKGDTKEVQDLSKVKGGLSLYKNYIYTTIGMEEKSNWEMNLPSEWDIYGNSYTDSLNTKVGLNQKEYILVQLNDGSKITDLQKYCDEIKEKYSNNFNSKLYKYMNSEVIKVAGFDAVKLVYSLEVNKIKYAIDEYYIKNGDIVYDITLKIQENKYEEDKDKYNKILESFKPVSKDNDEMSKEIKKLLDDNQMKRLGESDGPSKYENKKYNWNINIPGYWKNEQLSYDKSTEIFSNPNTGGAIFAGALDGEFEGDDISDETRLVIVEQIIKDENTKLISKESRTKDNINLTCYKYRIDDEERDVFGDADVYTFTKGKYSYYFVNLMPDVYASDKNLKEVQDIWNSFNVTEK